VTDAIPKRALPIQGVGRPPFPKHRAYDVPETPAPKCPDVTDEELRLTEIARLGLDFRRRWLRCPTHGQHPCCGGGLAR
jgi:hypothetical protein